MLGIYYIINGWSTPEALEVMELAGNKQRIQFQSLRHIKHLITKGTGMRSKAVE